MSPRFDKKIFSSFILAAVLIVGFNNCQVLNSSGFEASQSDPYLDSLNQLASSNSGTSHVKDQSMESSSSTNSSIASLIFKAAKIERNNSDGYLFFIKKADSWEQVQVTGGRFLIRDFIQPAIDRLAQLGAGDVYLQAGAKSFDFITGDSERVILKSKVNLVGLNDQLGAKPTIQIQKEMGNVFFIDQQQNLTIKNLRVLANKKGNYVFSAGKAKNILFEDIDVVLPQATAFGHFACQNVTYRRCTAQGDNPYQGHGFALGGNDGTVQDTNTTLIDCRSIGFAHPTGGQGLQMRPPLPSYGSNPRMMNLNVKIQGGDYSNNLVGIWLQGSDQTLIQNANIESNAMYGILLNAELEGILDQPNRLQVQNSNIRWNGSNQRPHAGVYANRSNMTIDNCNFDGNRPHHILAGGSNLYLNFANFYSTIGAQPYNLGFFESGANSYVKFHSGSLGPVLFETFENSNLANVEF